LVRQFLGGKDVKAEANLQEEGKNLDQITTHVHEHTPRPKTCCKGAADDDEDMADA